MADSARDLLRHELELDLACETCESEIDLLDDVGDRGVCRHCGLAFDLGPVVARAAAS